MLLLLTGLTGLAAGAAGPIHFAILDSVLALVRKDQRGGVNEDEVKLKIGGSTLLDPNSTTVRFTLLLIATRTYKEPHYCPLAALLSSPSRSAESIASY
jgi:hypothetical protein